MNRAYAYFDELPVGTEFSLNGNKCKKRSTRTANFTWNGHTSWAYFRAKELCIVAPYSRLSPARISEAH